MLRRDLVRILGLTLTAATGLSAQESYAVFQPPPRLLLSEDRLRLLRREFERRNDRWRQLETLLQGGAPFPEPVFAHALGHLASSDESLARKAFEALRDNTSPHEVALLYDWCGEALSSSQRDTLQQRLRAVLNQPLAKDAPVTVARNITMAAIAMSDDAPEESAKALGRVHQTWWPGVHERIRNGKIPFPHTEALPFVEILYSFQRGLQLDLRESAISFFRDYPIWHLLRHYPPSLAGGENDYRIPAFSGGGEPNVDDAVRSRAAELAMVALDTNAPESQYLQGWLLNPRFRMRSMLGAPYEYFWCNPYQPSLSYFYLPLYQHLPKFGTLLIRSSWEENALWLGEVDGALQLFTEEGIRIMQFAPANRTLQLGPSTVVLEGTQNREDSWSIAEAPECERVFWLGLKPSARYELEIDGEELTEADASPDGVLEINFENRGQGSVAIRPRGRGADQASQAE
jgi:hypothetical protein